MITDDGYSLVYDEKRNRIVIGLPPTLETATDTATKIPKTMVMKCAEGVIVEAVTNK